MNLFEFVIHQPFSTTIVIILCVITIIGYIFNKIMAQEANYDLDKNIIRSLIMSRGPKGATLNEIKREYF